MLWSCITLSTHTHEMEFFHQFLISKRTCENNLAKIQYLVPWQSHGEKNERTMILLTSASQNTHTLWPAAHWSVDTVEDMKPNTSVAQWPWKVVEKIPLNVPLNMVFYNRICPCVCQWHQLSFFSLLQWTLGCVRELNMWMMHQVFIASMTSNDFTIYLLWKQWEQSEELNCKLNHSLQSVRL